jgi:UDP-N-acetylmuramate dehydrogenase
MEFQANYPLSKITTFQIGGPASFFVVVTDLSELKQALGFAREKGLKVLVLGGGSNILISDQGFDGLVIQNKITNFKIEDSGLITIGAGENWDDVVVRTVDKNLSGVECLSGVPGSAGGAVVQNIGAYGQTIGDVVVKVEAIEIATGEEKIFSAVECEFEYRTSWFKKNQNKYVVISFTLKLSPNGTPTIEYLPVKQHFENRSPSLKELRNFIIETRASKGYLIMPGYERFNTAGSFFKNPVVTKEQYERLKSILGDTNLNRFWPVPKGVKLAAAFLMQEAGFTKGYRDGNVGISPKHSLSIVNFGGASAAEVKSLAEKIKTTVLEKFGVHLEEEVLFV